MQARLLLLPLAAIALLAGCVSPQEANAPPGDDGIGDPVTCTQDEALARNGTHEADRGPLDNDAGQFQCTPQQV